jgi:hypothetical protein
LVFGNAITGCEEKDIDVMTSTFTWCINAKAESKKNSKMQIASAYKTTAAGFAGC